MINPVQFGSFSHHPIQCGFGGSVRKVEAKPEMPPVYYTLPVLMDFVDSFEKPNS